MDTRKLIEFMGILEKLKCNTRHSWTSSGRRESVAEHSWRLAMLCLLVRDRLAGIDPDKLLKMCLIHDIGEAVCGDIPSFEKTEADDCEERQAVEYLLAQLPEPLCQEWSALFAEMRAMETPEAKAWRALDMMEAVFQHNEADLSTWLPLERELNLTYGAQEAEAFAWLAQLRAALRKDSEKKLRDRRQAKAEQ